MINKLVVSAFILACSISNPIFATTLNLVSMTGDKIMDGIYEIQKTDPKDWRSADGTITGHKIVSNTTPSIVPGVHTYQGLQIFTKKGQPPLKVHFTGVKVSKSQEYGTFLKIDSKTGKITGYGHYTYDK